MPRRNPPTAPPTRRSVDPDAAGPELLSRYTRLIVRRRESDDEPAPLIGRIPAIPGCYVVGADRQEVLEALVVRGREQIERLLLSGQPLPEPDLPPGFEGLVIDRTE